MKPRFSIKWLPFLWLAVSLACSLVVPSTPSTTEQPPSTDTPLPPPPAATLEGKIAFSSQRDGTWQIMAMNADGSDETSLTKKFGTYARPAWSPDGTKLGVRIDIDTGSGIAVMDVRHENGRLTGSQPVAITDAFADSPRWSPDGKKLIYSAAEGSGGWLTYLADITSGTTTQLTGIPENSIDLDWSPDGSRIAFSFYTDAANQVSDLYVINVDGTGLTQLTNTPNIGEAMPAWSPDGSRIAFAAYDNSRGPDYRQDIFIFNSDGTNLFQLTSDPASDFDPAWSPDGRQIAFASERNANNDANLEIYLINADGTGEMRLTNNHYTDRWPSWRARQAEDAAPAACEPALSQVGDVTIPAGTRFADPQAFSKVWRVQNTGTCTWTPTSYRLRWVEGEQMGAAAEIMIPGAIQPGAAADLVVPLVAPDSPGSHQGAWQMFDGAGQAVPGPDGNPAHLAVSIEVLPPGSAVLPQPLYFLLDTANGSQVFRLETDANSYTQVTDESQRVASFDVSADGRLAYMSQGDVVIVDPTGANRQVVANVGSEAFRFRLAWSPDGSKLAYSLDGIRVYNASTAGDSLLLADSGTMVDRQAYEPLEWSPDGSKLLAHVYQWESAAQRIISVADGAVLAEIPALTLAWSSDSRSVYFASSYADGMMPADPGLWRSDLTAAAPQALVSNAFVWWPVQSSDGSLLYFMDNQSSLEDASRTVLLYRSDAAGVNAQNINPFAFQVHANDVFDVRWSKDTQYFAVQLRHLALGVDEVLFFDHSGAPPLFLMPQASQMKWGP
jgi:TolB protein